MKLYINCVTNYMFLEIYISAPIFFIFVQGNYDRGREILLIIYLFIICLFNMEHNNYYMYNKQFFCLSIFFFFAFYSVHHPYQILNFCFSLFSNPLTVCSKDISLSQLCSLPPLSAYSSFVRFLCNF